jgi:hypothetical protein
LIDEVQSLVYLWTRKSFRWGRLLGETISDMEIRADKTINQTEFLTEKKNEYSQIVDTKKENVELFHTQRD